jgi:alpha-1,2-mannosyltransferase
VAVTIGAVGLAAAAVLARHGDWLSAVAATGATGLVSPISWTHHWVWIVPGLAVLLRGGRASRIAALCGYVLFVLAPMWWTPHHGGPREYGYHGWVTLVVNCYLIAGLAFLSFLSCLVWRANRIRRKPSAVSGTPVREEPAAMVT